MRSDSECDLFSYWQHFLFLVRVKAAMSVLAAESFSRIPKGCFVVQTIIYRFFVKHLEVIHLSFSGVTVTGKFF
jgi:hypothetical protein